MRMLKLACCVLIASTMTGLAGCRTMTPQEAEAHHLAEARRAAAKIPPEGSRFSRIQPGMDMVEVAAAIGLPEAKGGRPTSKNYNPVYFGKDRYRTTWYYRGQGRITFNVTARVLLIDYDVSETGEGPQPTRAMRTDSATVSAG